MCIRGRPEMSVEDNVENALENVPHPFVPSRFRDSPRGKRQAIDGAKTFAVVYFFFFLKKKRKRVLPTIVLESEIRMQKLRNYREITAREL